MNFIYKTTFLLVFASTVITCATQNTQQQGEAQPGRYKQLQDTAPEEEFDFSKVIEATPKQEVLSKYGNHSPYYVYDEKYEVIETNENFSEEGIASWYGTKFHGELTSSREKYDMYAMTAAHKTLPLPSYVKVENLENGKQVTVKVNDRGPFKKGRIIDLSYAAAHRLDMHEAGTAPVKVTTLPPFLKPEDNPNKENFIFLKNRFDFPVGKDNYLQVGVYADKQTALILQTSLVSQVRSNVILLSDTSNAQQLLHKVRIGPIRTLSELESTQEVLISRNLPHYFLITSNQ